MRQKLNRTLRTRIALSAAICFGGACLSIAGQSAPNAPGAEAATYLNPVIDSSFPDPSLLRDRGIYYAYSTNHSGDPFYKGDALRKSDTLPCARSVDLVHWTLLPDAMPTLPAWVIPGHTWAPQVTAFVPGKRYVTYFTAHSKDSDLQAIGVAVASSPTGPFVSVGDEPLIEQRDLGGAIDASCFVDGNTRYLVWKNDGNSRGLDTWLWAQKLSVDGLTLVGTPTKFIKQDQKWEGNLVEAPILWKHGAKYYLFYSANNYSGCDYGVGYAVAPSPLGPFVKPRDTPWLASTPGVCGPGGEDIVIGPDGRTWMSYHSWAKGPGSYRSMSVDPLVWNGDVPYLLGPSRWPQPAPARLPGATK